MPRKHLNNRPFSKNGVYKRLDGSQYYLDPSSSRRAKMNRNNQRSCNWCFTLPNYTDEDETALKALAYQYLIYGKEVCPTTETPHLQGYVVFSNQKTLSALKALMGRRYHLEVTNGSAQQNQTYCSKDGIIYEDGTAPISKKRCGEMEKERWSVAMKLAKEGRFMEIEDQLLTKYVRTYEHIYERYVPKKLADLCELTNEWICGRSGIGKSTTARKENPLFYRKNKNKWWCGYNDEPCVIVDNVTKFDVALASDLEMWGDYYPFLAEVKCGSKNIRPSKVVVTSQFRIEEIWESSEETKENLLRRYKVRVFGKWNALNRIFE